MNSKQTVFSLIFLSDKEISEVTGIPLRTVEGIILKLKEELNVETRVAALWQGMVKGMYINWTEFDMRYL
jgi:hypothetical protein